MFTNGWCRSAVYANRHYLSSFRLTKPDALAAQEEGHFQVKGDVYVHHTATIDPTAVVKSRASCLSVLMSGFAALSI